ncbi:MAG: hypothetical protein CMQ05_02005 [Gammaproteobacteria bacterium]|nr:hypothetical protein [Gammaproteobacteria bacterium]
MHDIVVERATTERQAPGNGEASTGLIDTELGRGNLDCTRETAVQIQVINITQSKVCQLKTTIPGDADSR